MDTRHLIEADISNYIFSDECYIKLFEDPRLIWSKAGSPTPKLQPKLNPIENVLMCWKFYSKGALNRRGRNRCCN